MSSYYNEIDPYAAAWLRNLIEAGLIAPGEVDERSIEDVTPDDLRGFTQCHFFAGIGVWSYALRNAGWSDDRPVWTGSCPCPPFSSAGKGQRCPECGSSRNLCHPRKTGHFICLDCGCDRFADGRHLWPEFARLIKARRPPRVVGEQVASADGRLWLAVVQADLATMGYTSSSADLCAAGFGGAHIRQRTYFVGVADDDEQQLDGCRDAGSRGRRESTDSRSPRGLADAAESGRQRASGGSQEQRASELRRVGGVDDASSARHVTEGVGAEGEARDETRLRVPSEGRDESGTSAPLLGRQPVDWLYCRDEKWRPVEPGTFPLAHAASARVGRLRAYGNALDAETAINFAEAVSWSLGDDLV